MSEEGLSNSDAPVWRAVIERRRACVALIECCAGVGSGLLVSTDGLVVTNRHVAEQAQVYMIRFHDGSRAKALLVHTHGSRDLALLRAAIKRETCFDIEQDVATDSHAGDDVLAIGHPRGLAFTSTRGIVSEPHRRLPDGEYVQTDVAINPGNSGGPLLDRSGKLVGLNTRVHENAEGLGFAIGGGEVRAYVLYVQDQIRRRHVRSPSDEEITAAVKPLSPLEVALAAVRGSALASRKPSDDGRVTRINMQSPGGCAFTVSVGEGQFAVVASIATGLSSKQQVDGKMLLQLMRWQTDLCGPCFDIRDHTLSLGFRRSVEGLDVAEAREAILRMSDALDKLYRPILKLLGR